MTYKLTIAPNGFSAVERAAVQQLPTKGGFSRFRGDLQDASIVADVTWFLSEQQYTNLQLFWKVGTDRGQDAFLIDLPIDNGAMEEHTAYFASGLRVTDVQGLNYTVQASLEVLPNAVDIEFDTSLCAVYAASGRNITNYLGLLDSLVNSAWPEA